MKRLVFLSVFCCLFGSTVLAQDWINLAKTSPESPIVNLTCSDNQQVAFTLEVCGMYKQDITEGNETFQRIEIPSGVHFQKPAIPNCLTSGNSLPFPNVRMWF